MKYALIIDSIVVQVQPNEQEGFIKVGDDVVCGMIKEGDTFINPIIIKTQEEIDSIRIQEIDSKCNQAIESVYPMYKQINITNLLTPYTEEDRDVMKDFIDSKRAICHKAIADGTNIEDINWEVTNG